MKGKNTMVVCEEKRSENGQNVLDHEFEGWSVWLEPELISSPNSQWFQEESENLCQECGGMDSGLIPVPLHCTLLYNFAPLRHKSQEELEELLRRCINESSSHGYHDIMEEKKDCTNEEMTMTPTEFYFFPYPKSADDGKGFGCVISLLILDCTPGLQRLYDTVQSYFPPHERAHHPKFQPHMALIYAPEKYHDLIQSKTNHYSIHQQSLLQQPLKIKYLSIWNTQGTLSQWKRIAKIPLPS